LSGENEHEAQAVVDAIISDFGHNRVDEYFTHFAPDATFIFHTSPVRLESRAEYEALWAEWVRESSFAVLSCISTDRKLSLYRDIAIFTHSVSTVVSIDGATETQLERESIILELRDGHWLCIHEHLSGRDA
jgi:ketosteroid isomerase-like protein